MTTPSSCSSCPTSSSSDVDGVCIRRSDQTSMESPSEGLRFGKDGRLPYFGLGVDSDVVEERNDRRLMVSFSGRSKTEPVEETC
jgi:hypothetical protein